MKKHFLTIIFRICLCTVLVSPFQATAAETTALETPQLVLTDRQGRPFYPTDTHVFTNEGFETASIAAPLADVPTQTRSVAAHVPVISADKPPAAVAQRATVLRRSETLVQSRAPHPVVSGNLMDSDIMDSWSVGVFR